jgi:signal transduction histidine kinase
MHKKHAPNWTAIFVTFTVAFSATSAILFLRGWAKHAAESTLQLTELHQKIARLDALEYRGIAAKKLKSKYLTEAQEILAASQTLIQAIPQDGLQSHSELVASFDNYSKAITEVLTLLSKGEIKQARIADQERLDPTHDHLEDLLRDQRQFSAAFAEQKNIQADIGTIAAILISAVVISATLQKVFQANRLTEIAMAEQKLLQASEAVLRQERELLEGRVAERTHEVEYQNFILARTLEQLRSAQAELVESEKMVALGHLVAGIAHEINTPLGAIQASSGNMDKALQETLGELPQIAQRLTPQQQIDFLALLERVLQSKAPVTSSEKRPLRRALTQELETHKVEHPRQLADRLVDIGIFDEVTPYLNLLQSVEGAWVLQLIYNLSRIQGNNRTITTAVERASKIVFALKSYARFGQSDTKQPVQITEGIETVLELYRSKLKHGIEIVRRYDPIPELLGYPDELLQVWTNLIHNAIQAMEGKGKLEIEAAVQANQVVVTVIDSGKGIATETQAKIFEPFFTTKPQGEGSGLGLSISRTIIEKHEGSIEVSSQPGRTIFTVQIPLQPESPQPETVVPPPLVNSANAVAV